MHWGGLWDDIECDYAFPYLIQWEESEKDGHIHVSDTSVVSITPPSPVGCDPIVITYNASGRNLMEADPVHIHLGRTVDEVRWRDVISTAMTRNGVNWTYTYHPPPGTEEISIAFNDGANTWDNNDRQDWHFTVDGCEDATSGLD